jgi:hypothetical protein
MIKTAQSYRSTTQLATYSAWENQRGTTPQNIAFDEILKRIPINFSGLSHKKRFKWQIKLIAGSSTLHRCRTLQA